VYRVKETTEACVAAGMAVEEVYVLVAEVCGGDVVVAKRRYDVLSRQGR
jgi:hypothetical protein